MVRICKIQGIALEPILEQNFHIEMIHHTIKIDNKINWLMNCRQCHYLFFASSIGDEARPIIFSQDLMDPKITIYSDLISKNWALWCHFVNRPCQGNLTLCRSENLDQLCGDISLFKIFNLCKFYSPFVSPFGFVPDLVEVDGSTADI